MALHNSNPSHFKGPTVVLPGSAGEGILVEFVCSSFREKTTNPGLVFPKETARKNFIPNPEGSEAVSMWCSGRSYVSKQMLQTLGVPRNGTVQAFLGQS